MPSRSLLLLIGIVRDVCVNIDFSNHVLIDTINFYHKLEYPKLKDLAKHLLKKDYTDKKQSYNLTLIKKCFLKYSKML